MKWLRIGKPEGGKLTLKRIASRGLHVFAVYIGIGLSISVILWLCGVAGVWNDFNGAFNIPFALMCWGVCWPWWTVIVILAHAWR